MFERLRAAKKTIIERLKGEQFIDRYPTAEEMKESVEKEKQQMDLAEQLRIQEYNTTPCNCANKGEMEVVEAIVRPHLMVLKEYCDENDIDYVEGSFMNIGGQTQCDLSLVVDHIRYEISYPYSIYEKFVKCACVTCGTCLGWCSARSKDRVYNTATPFEKVKKQIDIQINLVREQTLKKARAREICNV